MSWRDLIQNLSKILPNPNFELFVHIITFLDIFCLVGKIHWTDYLSFLVFNCVTVTMTWVFLFYFPTGVFYTDCHTCRFMALPVKTEMNSHCLLLVIILTRLESWGIQMRQPKVVSMEFLRCPLECVHRPCVRPSSSHRICSQLASQTVTQTYTHISLAGQLSQGRSNLHRHTNLFSLNLVHLS